MTAFGGHTQIVLAQGVREPKISEYIKPEMGSACSKLFYGVVAESFRVGPQREYSNGQLHVIHAVMDIYRHGTFTKNRFRRSTL